MGDVVGLKNVIGRIKEQRYLFLLALVLIVGTFSAYNQQSMLGIAVLVLGFILVIVEMRGKKPSHGFSVALIFPAAQNVSTIDLVKGECIVRDPRHPDKPKPGSVLPHQGGGGWMCPLPTHLMEPGDAVDLTFTDKSGQKWAAKRFVPDNSWPTIEVQLAN